MTHFALQRNCGRNRGELADQQRTLRLLTLTFCSPLRLCGSEVRQSSQLQIRNICRNSSRHTSGRKSPPRCFQGDREHTSQSLSLSDLNRLMLERIKKTRARKCIVHIVWKIDATDLQGVQLARYFSCPAPRQPTGPRNAFRKWWACWTRMTSSP